MILSSLSLSLWIVGNAVIQNIELNTEELEGLNLPFHIRRGLVRELRVVLPWTSLLSDSVVLEVHGLSVRICPLVLSNPPN